MSVCIHLHKFQNAATGVTPWIISGSRAAPAPALPMTHFWSSSGQRWLTPRGDPDLASPHSTGRDGTARREQGPQVTQQSSRPDRQQSSRPDRQQTSRPDRQQVSRPDRQHWRRVSSSAPHSLRDRQTAYRDRPGGGDPNSDGTHPKILIYVDCSMMKKATARQNRAKQVTAAQRARVLPARPKAGSRVFRMYAYWRGDRSMVFPCANHPIHAAAQWIYAQRYRIQLLRWPCPKKSYLPYQNQCHSRYFIFDFDVSDIFNAF